MELHLKISIRQSVNTSSPLMSLTVPQRILDGGFRIGGVDGHPMAHGSSCGRGVYLAASAAMSMGYIVPEAGRTTNRIFGCRGMTPSNLNLSPPS